MVDRERLFESLVAFICERTGLARVEVEGVFEADAEFWTHHPRDAQAVFLDEES